MFSFSSSSKSKKYGSEVEVDITRSDCRVTIDGAKSGSQTNKEKEKSDKNNAGMNSESSKNTWWQQNESKREKEEALPKTVKSHHNSGGVHVGGHNFGTITLDGNAHKSSKNSQKPDKYGKK
uniref:Uncharacterized protein n=1 Tax=Panagrolaimus superbus TaxID=310955 RepID=A0A914YFV4_9BILA